MIRGISTLCKTPQNYFLSTPLYVTGVGTSYSYNTDNDMQTLERLRRFARVRRE